MEEVVKIQTDDNWWEIFEYALTYSKNHNGNLDNMPSFLVLMCKNGQTVNLRNWVLKQQSGKYKLDSKQRKALEEIGLKFIEELYILAQQFYKKNGHLCVPRDFVTTNDYIKEGIKLGMKLYNLKNTCKNEDEKHLLFDCIGMIWDKSKNRYEILKLCYELGIDAEKNKNVLLHKAIAEFKAKIAYIIKELYFLKPDIDIVDEDGFLHEIFSMHDDEMKSCYGVTLAELVKKYNCITLEELVELYRYFQCNKRVQSWRTSK